jgi:hypothetical protein
MKTYGDTALADDEFCMSPEERIKYSLEVPNRAGALSPRQLTPIMKARINYQLANMAAELQGEATQWIRDLARTSPRQALEAYFELLKFTTPQQKAAEITHNVNDARPAKVLTVAELQEALANANAVVSTQ